MDVPLLRIMTWKSVINFGQYKSLTVRHVFDLGHTRYLRWIYYCMDGLSFNEEVLRAIAIVSDYRDDTIIKPGTDIELHNELSDNYTYINKLGKYPNQIKKMLSVQAKGKMIHRYYVDRRSFSKGNMQRINQGR
jgi:hypothetical protein